MSNKLSSSAISRRSFLKTITAGTSSILLLGPAGLLSDTGEEWWFVHISDTHNGGERSAETLRQVLNDINNTFPDTRFVMCTGDISGHGWQEELAENYAVMEKSGLPYYNIMGNHDSRWSRSGQKDFIDIFGGTHWAIHQPYLSVFAINSAVLLEQYGFLAPEELGWLEDRLQKQNGQPSLLAFHHPPSAPKNFLGSEQALYHLAHKYNIRGILAGHIHQNSLKQVNDIQVITSGAATNPASGYRVFQVTKEKTVMYTRNPIEDSTTMVSEFSNAVHPVRQYKKSPFNVEPATVTRSLVSFPGEYDKITGSEIFINGNSVEPLPDEQALTLPVKSLPQGKHQVLFCSPSAKADVQERRWSDFTLSGGAIAPRWQQYFHSAIQHRPAMAEDALYFGNNLGEFFAVNSADGSIRWNIRPTAYSILSSPILFRETIIFGTMDRVVFARKVTSGLKKWEQSVDGSVIASPVIYDKTLLIGTGAGTLVAMDPGNGAKKWTFTAENLIKATPAYHNGTILFGAWDGHFYCVDIGTGDLVWKRRINTPHYSPATCNPKVKDGRVYFVSHDYRTHCLDADTGEILWQYPEPGVEFQWNSPIVSKCKPSYSSGIFHGKNVYFCSLTGHVVGFNQHTGEHVYEYELADPVFDSFPILVGDIMYFGTIRGRLCALNLATGIMDWEYSTGYHYIFSGPESNGNTIAVGNMGGYMTLFEPGTTTG